MGKNLRFSAIVLTILFLTSACTTKQDGSIPTPDKIEPPMLNWINYQTQRQDNRDLLDIKIQNEYKINIEFDPQGKRYTGKQTVKYINNEDVPLNEIYFHIYPNAFKDNDTTPYTLNSYVEGFEPGSIEISKVTVGGKEIQASILGTDSTLLKIPLESALFTGDAVEINMEYEVLLPHATEKFGYGDNTFQVGNGYPIAAVYDSREWNIEPYYSMGDPFYSDVSNYNVTITAPKDYIIACSGKILSEEVHEENKVWTIEAKLMRDFAWAASQLFVIREKLVDGVLVKNYLLPNDEAINTEAAELAYKSVEVYNEIFGNYPYESLSVVTADATGMEYPGLVFVWKSNKPSDKNLESTIIHEVSHQWWYGAVGNNQIDEAWLDESFAIYAQKLYYDEVLGEESGDQYYSNKIVSNYNKRRSGDNEAELILTPVYKFEDWNQYTAMLHKGAMFLHELETSCGKGEFYKILNIYYERYKFSNATTKDFIEVCEEVLGRGLEEDINKWFFDQ